MSFTVAGVAHHGSAFPEQWPGVEAPSTEWQFEEFSSSRGGPLPDGGSTLSVDRSDQYSGSNKRVSGWIFNDVLDALLREARQAAQGD
jgi:hypothetical protein